MNVEEHSERRWTEFQMERNKEHPNKMLMKNEEEHISLKRKNTLWITGKRRFSISAKMLNTKK